MGAGFDINFDIIKKGRPQGDRPNRSPAKRVRFGEEERRNERAMTFVKKSSRTICSPRRRGDPAEIRTPDTLLKRQVLCRLSYWVMKSIKRKTGLPPQLPDQKTQKKVAGMAGLEPASEGVKVPCLTTWLHPCISVRWGEIEKARTGADAPALTP